MLDLKRKIAVEGLLMQDSPDGFINTLDDLFDTWLSSSITDGADAEERSLHYQNYKSIKKFLFEISICEN